MKEDLSSDLPLVPGNPLEDILVRGKAGEIPPEDCVCAMLDDWLYVPSITEVQDDGSKFAPILLRKGNGDQFITAFSSLSRAGTVSDRAKFCLRIRGRELVRRIPSGFGLLVNPGYAVRLDLTAAGLHHLRRGR